MESLEEIDRAKVLLRDAPLPLIAARIKRARTDLGFSHDVLGARMGGVLRQTLINLEKGKHRPTLATLDKIAQATGKPIDFFLVEVQGPDPFREAA